MFWNKKGDAHALPDLPPVKVIPRGDFSPAPAPMDDMQDEDTMDESHGLPSFPDSPMQKGFSQSAIKDAVSQEEVHAEEEERIPSPTIMRERNFKTVEMESPWINSMSQPAIAPPPVVERPAYRPARESEIKKDVFVKIEKFYSARKALENTKEKLDEIDELLRKIRETKLREEQELNAWEKELIEVKSRIHEVVENIFDKIE